MMNKKTVHFISHTHWDREWYLPFERFRFRLVQLIDRVLNLVEQNSDFRYFHLDGQTIVLDDYLQIRPENKERLFQKIREGRIIVGPWYEQNDLFLTSAESTVRNLMEGIRVARALGGEMKVGYLPDHFGLTGQMPQIFQQAGFEASVFGRGYDHEKHGSTLIRWQAPDGSEVLGIWMANWYNNAQRLPNEAEKLRALFPLIEGREEALHAVPHTLMMNGVDHLEAQEDLPEVLAKLRALFGERYEFVHGTLDGYTQAVKDYLREHAGQSCPVVRGELRERDDYFILGGTLSSRVYVKQANMEGHHLLEKWLEPISAWAALHGLDAYDCEYMRYIWKLYMHNHPHDSICGCSQDAVHDHMMDRYAALQEIGMELLDRKLNAIVNQIDAESFDKGNVMLAVFNMSQTVNREVVQTSVYFMKEDLVDSFMMVNAKGESVPYRIMNKHESKLQVLSPINLPGVVEVMRYDIEWCPEAPALGYETYCAVPRSPGNVVTNERTAVQTPPELENGHFKVEMQSDGTFHLLDKKTAVRHRSLGMFEEIGDRGDLYVFTAAGEPLVWRGPVEWLNVTRNALYEECVYRFAWEVPEELEDGGERGEGMEACDFTVRLRLSRNARQVNMSVEIDNKAKDHRFRVLFRTAQRASRVWAGGQFDVVERAWEEGREYERSANTQPYWKLVAPLWDDRTGLAIFAKGVAEYETLGAGEAIALTLLRGTCSINKRENIRLESDFQPKGQCLGVYRFDFAVRPFAGEKATILYQEAECFTQGLMTKQRAIDDDRWERGHAWVQDAGITETFRRPDPNREKPRLARSGILLDIEGNAMLSALKWAENGEGLAVRFYSVEHEDTIVKVAVPGQAFGAVMESNFLEEPKRSIPVPEDGESISCNLGAKKIVSILCALEGDASEI